MRSRKQAELLEEAEEWQSRLANGGPAERAAFAGWVRRSPEHLQVFLEHLALETELHGLDLSQQFDLEELMAHGWGNVVPLAGSAPATPRGPGSTRLQAIARGRYALAASLIVIALLLGLLLRGWFFRQTPDWTDYVTATGEQRRIALPDGTIIEMNTQSHLRVADLARSREVELLAGEAVFNVQHKADRPFRVHARAAMFEDLGTQFSIYVLPDGNTSLGVLEGRVQLSHEGSTSLALMSASQSTARTNREADVNRGAGPEQIVAGEQIYVDSVGRLIKRVPLDITEAAAWRQHKIWFENAPLVQIAAEFNRYNTRKIQVVEGSLIDQKRYTATFDPYDPDSFIEYLHESDPNLVVKSRGSYVVIQARE